MDWLCNSCVLIGQTWLLSKAFGFYMPHLIVLKFSILLLHVKVHVHTEFHRAAIRGSRVILAQSSSLKCVILHSGSKVLDSNHWLQTAISQLLVIPLCSSLEGSFVCVPSSCPPSFKPIASAVSEITFEACAIFMHHQPMVQRDLLSSISPLLLGRFRPDFGRMLSCLSSVHPSSGIRILAAEL